MQGCRKFRCEARSVNPQPMGDIEVNNLEQSIDEVKDSTPKTKVDGGADLEDMNEVDKLVKRLGVLSELVDEPQLDFRTAFKNTVEELQILDVFTGDQYKLLKNYTHQLFKDV